MIKLFDELLSSYLPDTLSELSESSVKSAEISFKSDLTSAENVAINLLKNFNEQRLPKASELEWLVSEEEAPQKVSTLYYACTVNFQSTIPWEF